MPRARAAAARSDVDARGFFSGVVGWRNFPDCRAFLMVGRVELLRQLVVFAR